MRHDDFLVDHVIAFEKVRIARVIVDDHFVDLVQSVRIALVQALIFHPELPVRVPVRKSAVRRDHVHLFEIQDLEERFIEVETVLARVLLDFQIESGQFRCEALSPRLDGHGHRCLLTLTQKILDRLVNVVLALDARSHKVVDVGNVVLEFANELAAAIRAFHLTVAE